MANFIPYQHSDSHAAEPDRGTDWNPSQWSTMDLIMGRESGLGNHGKPPFLVHCPNKSTAKWSMAQKRGALCPSRLPGGNNRVLSGSDQPTRHRFYNQRNGGHAYTGKFSKEGDIFVAGFQDHLINVYKV